MTIVLDAAIGFAWAMEEIALTRLFEIAAREHPITPQALEAYRAEALERGERATVRNGVAILQVEGPLFKRASLVTEHCGASSYDVLRRDLATAVDSSQMRKHPLDKSHMLEVHAARRFHELLRQDHARDAQWRKDQARARARADQKAARVDGLVRTAEVRISGCKDAPTQLAVRQMCRIAKDAAQPGRVRVAAAGRILEWVDWAPGGASNVAEA